MDIAKIVITVIYVIAALSIIVVVLLQEGKSAGLGSLGGAASTGNNSYWDKNKKHSLEGKFERWTQFTAGLFIVLAVILMVVS